MLKNLEFIYSCKLSLIKVTPFPFLEESSLLISGNPAKTTPDVGAL